MDASEMQHQSQAYETCLSFSGKGRQRRFRIRMGSRDATPAAAGDAGLTGNQASLKLHEPKVTKIDESAKKKYFRGKKKISRRSALLSLSNRKTTSFIDPEVFHGDLARTKSGILDDDYDNDESGNESTSNLDASGFPYYRSWCSGHCKDAVLVKDACVSCTMMGSNFETYKPSPSEDTTLERKLLKQLKIEYKDLSAITSKISAYTKDILASISTKAGMRSSPPENTNEDCSLRKDRDFTTQPVAMQYFDKSGRPCLKLRLRDSRDLPRDREANHHVGNNKGPMQRIFANRFSSIDEASSTCSSSSMMYNYLMFTRRRKIDDKQ